MAQNGQVVEEEMGPKEVNRRVNFVYQNLSEQFGPAVKVLTESGHQLFRSMLTLAKAQRNYAIALERVANASEHCHTGTQDIGDCLREMSQMMEHFQKMHDDTIAWYSTQMLGPIEMNHRNDAGNIKQLWNDYYKGQKKIYKQLKKNNQNTMQVDTNLTTSAYQLRLQGLNQALTEEKKRYGFVLERHCAWFKQYTNFTRQVSEVMDESLVKWFEYCPNFNEEPNSPTALALFELDEAIEQEETREEPLGNGVDDEGEKASISLDSLPDHPPEDGQKQVEAAAEITLLSHIKRSSFVSISNKSEEPHSSSVSPKSDSDSYSDEHQQVQPVASDVIFAAPADTKRVMNRSEDEQIAQEKENKVKALHDYQGKGETQLTLKAGDVIKVVKIGQQGWCFGIKDKDKKAGWYPASFAESM